MCWRRITTKRATAKVLDEIVVTETGTAIRGVAPIGAESFSFDQEDSLNSTSVDVTAFIAKLPQGSALGFREVDPSFGGNVGFAQGVNLRGLGTNATLVLFDGHRSVGQGVTEQFADPNMLPPSAIQRVEVVMDAASAVYGSDAIAGVVNFILQDDFGRRWINARYTDGLYHINRYRPARWSFLGLRQCLAGRHVRRPRKLSSK
ncbi:MAG: TonB-dependent receptor plug domain-containing protein [Woeseiaceae bacterium]|nr:TonB-dependent receptor plug domain-containing protein [Woeseiaceae bacterium]